jgi:hypothetical protein
MPKRKVVSSSATCTIRPVGAIILFVILNLFVILLSIYASTFDFSKMIASTLVDLLTLNIAVYAVANRSMVSSRFDITVTPERSAETYPKYANGACQIMRVKYSSKSPSSVTIRSLSTTAVHAIPGVTGVNKEVHAEIASLFLDAQGGEISVPVVLTSNNAFALRIVHVLANTCQSDIVIVQDAVIKGELTIDFGEGLLFDRKFLMHTSFVIGGPASES